MKTKATITVLFLFIVLSGISRANPIIERFFTELTFDTNGWKLEMRAHTISTLDGWSLRSKVGRSYFKNGIRADTGYVVLTNSDMLSPLVVDQQDDSLFLYSSTTLREQLAFSNTRSAMIAAPHPGQSICATETGDHYWYLDNTPTIGRPNDFLNARGTVQGTVRNTTGHPISFVQVLYDLNGLPGSIYTDTSGHFEFSFIAAMRGISFSHRDYQFVWKSIQIWPESTVTQNVTLISAAFYPLHIGNRWNWGFERKITGDTLMPNGKRYVKLLDPGHRQHPFQRVEGHKVYAYEFKGSIDQLVYDFTRIAGDTISTVYRPTDTTDIILLSTGDGNLFGRMRKQWGFLIDVRRRIDEELYQVITDSIGVTHEGGMWFSADLLGAMINGVKYGTITDVPDDDWSLPLAYKLYQNYPNPFNPSTTITYVLGHRSPVSLKVFDVLGREAAALVEEVQDSGFKSVGFDASALASGVYFYQLQAGGFVATKKLMLIK